MRLAVVTSHPIQYQAPLFRVLGAQLDLTVFFAYRATPADQAKAGFGVAFEWDVDLTSGYRSRFLANVARAPGPSHFYGCDTPEVGQRVRQGGFDAVLVMGWHLKSYWQAIWAAKRAGIPVLVRGDSHLGSPRGGVKSLLKEIMYPHALRAFDIALYVGDRSRAYWVHYGYPEQRMFFSPHCIDTQWFAARATPEARARVRARLGIRAKERVALFAGKLVSFKRPLDLVRAAAAMKAQGFPVSILVAGSGPLEPPMIAEAAELGVTLHRLGFCNQTEMPGAYAAADVLVLSSDSSETWGLVANEAQACGVPIVVSDACGCAPDLASDRKAGLTFACGNREALSNALREMLAQPPARAEILAKSARYSVAAAARGVEGGLAFAVEARTVVKSPW